jgi:hypothetical protein
MKSQIVIRLSWDEPCAPGAVHTLWLVHRSGRSLGAGRGALVEAGRLVVLKETHLPELPEMWVSPGTYRAWRERATSFEALGALTPETYNLTGQGEPVRVSAALVSVDLLGTLGVRPSLGRDFEAGEDQPGKADVAILGHASCAGRFGGRADVLGQTLVLDGRRVTVVGVMPSELAAPFAADVYRHFALEPAGKLSLVVRTRAEGGPVSDGVRAALRGVDPAQSTSAPRPVADALTATVTPR